MKSDLEARIYFKTLGYTDEYGELEEIMEDYLPNVHKCIGFTDERSDKRFVVKFHDILYYTNTDGEDKDMEQTTFDVLFDRFCDYIYESVRDFMAEENITDNIVFGINTLGHYKAFEQIFPEITEDNYLEITAKVFDDGLSPDYITDYTKLSDYLQGVEDNYFEDWLEFLAEEIPEETIKKMKERYEKYNQKN